MAKTEYSMPMDSAYWQEVARPGAGQPRSALTGSNQDDLARTMEALLANPQALQMLANAIMQMTQQGNMPPGMGGMDPLSAMMQRKPGYIGDPQQAQANSAGLWGDKPSGGDVQWLGGMPPGYNDAVARKLAIGANAGNLIHGSGLSKGLGGFGGALANLVPLLLPHILGGKG